MGKEDVELLKKWRIDNACSVNSKFKETPHGSNEDAFAFIPHTISGTIVDI